MAEISSQDQVQTDRACRKNQSNQPLRQDIQSARRCKTPAREPRRRSLFKRAKEKVISKRQPQANQHIGNEESRKDVRSDRGREHNSGVESAELAVCVP